MKLCNNLLKVMYETPPYSVTPNFCKVKRLFKFLELRQSFKKKSTSW